MDPQKPTLKKTLMKKNGFLCPVRFMDPQKPTLDDLRIKRSDKPESNLRIRPVAIGIFVLVLAAGVIWWLTRPKAIEVHTVVAREIGGAGGDHTVLNASGYVTARRAATVSSKVTGKVVEVLIEEGMKVKEGQVLARLDDTNIKTSLDVAQAQLESARAALDETRAQLKQANQEFQRITELAKQHIASQSDLDLAESNAKSLQAHLAQQEVDVTVAERNVAMWQQQMDDMIIRAPFAGIVTTKDAQPGEMISPVSAGGGFTRTGIGTVVDMDSLEIEIDVNESYINRVRSRPAGRGHAGRVSGLENSLQGHCHHPDRRPAKVHGQGARRFRPARPAHPAGDGGEGGVSRNRRRAGHGESHRAGPENRGAKPGRTGCRVRRPARPRRTPRRHGD